MAHVFISYSRRDSQFVGGLADRLRARGKDVWIDIEGIRDAEVFPVALQEAIESSDGFVFVISPASVESPYCMREIDNAVEYGKRIVPIDWERVPDEGVPEPIRVRNWIPAVEDLEETTDRIVKALDTDLDHVKAHTHWEIKAVEWDSKQRGRSLLLRGTELSEAESWVAGAESKDPPPTPLQREFFTVSHQAAAARSRRVATVSVGVAVVSLALLVFALIQRGQANSARETSESRAIALASEAQQSVDPERALLMAIEAAKKRETPDALFAVRSALDADPLLYRSPSLGAQTCSQPAPGVSYSPSGFVAAGLCNGDILLVGPNKRVVLSKRQRDPAAPLRYNPDGSMLAVAGNRRISIYDPQTLDLRASIPVPGYPQRIIFSDDGSRMAATSATTSRSWASVWNVRDWDLTMRHSEAAPSAGLSPLARGIGFLDGGRQLALGSPTGPVTIFASDNGRTLRKLPDEEDALIGYDPDGRWLVVGGFHTRGPHSREGVVTLWDSWTWRNPRVIATAPGLSPRNIVVSPDGSRVAVGWSDGSTGVYSLQLGSEIAHFLGPPKPVSQIAYSPDSRAVAVGSADGSVRVWRAGGAESAYTELGSRLDWDRPAVSNPELTVISPPNIVRKLALPGLVPLSTTRIPLPSEARYLDAWLSPTGDTAALLRSDGRMEAWDLRTNSRLLSVPALPSAIATISRDNSRMLVLDGKHNELVDLESGQITPIRERARFCRGEWKEARFSRDDSTVVAGANCGEVMAWDGRTGKLQRRLTTSGQTAALAFAHDGRTVAIASPDGTATLIDLRSGAKRPLPRAPRGINSITFGANDELLAAGVNDRTVRIWETDSGRQLRVLHLQAPAFARFTPDGRKLIVSELTGAIRAFEPCPACDDGGKLVKRASARVTRKLSDAERRTYLSGF